jgi:4-amino-4-deoxy-L-arabinose transferase-like glycosyltransferase
MSSPKGRRLGWPERQHVGAALALLLVLATAALIRTWSLSQNGFGRQYYAAGVRSMSESWHNFLYNAFDPAGFLSLDKPPVAIWLQVASSKLFGFNGVSILLPQVLAGLASILLLYLIVERSFGRPAAGWAALALALTPVSVAVDRSNNTESCLIAVLLVAAGLGMRAAETGRLAWLCAAMAVIGIGFNVKMGAALVLAPVIALTFGLAWRTAPLAWHLRRQAIAGTVMVVVSLSWTVIFDLTPATSRPYAGSTKGNSMLELALLHNGAARLLRPSSRVADAAIAPAAPAEPTGLAPASGAPRPALTDASPTGPLRLFRPRQASQAGWLLPLALLGLVLAWRQGTLSSQLSHRLGAGVWAGWLIAYWVVLSFAGGTVHTYYIAILAPPLAVFTGVALAELWSRSKAGLPRWVVPVSLLVVAAWQTYLFAAPTRPHASGGLGWIWLSSIGVLILSAIVLLVSPRITELARRAPAAAATCALFVMPSLAAASVVLTRPNTAAPVADISALASWPAVPGAVGTDARREAARQKLTSFLLANRGSAKYLVAVPNAVVAAPLIVATGLPVMAMGGYLGDDPILSPARLQRLVADGEIRFVLLGGFTLAPDKQAALAPIEQWVRTNGRLVERRRWQASAARPDRPFRIRLGDTLVEVSPPELFDLSPSSN